ncbi:MAG: phosphoribosylglycinamide formyltransferase [Deltaproteobacteria bacterium]|nr:phosphoribosylglycinamide formyltransferase [Deltaproteobacteria bacterium]
MIRLGILVSGSGSNLQAIMDSCVCGDIDGMVAVVISNVEEAYALKRAENYDIPTKVISHEHYPDRVNFDMQLVKTLKEFDVGLVVLAGFMRILTPEFLKHFPGRIMNIHPALLPSFPGLEVRQKAIDHGVKLSGCSVHFVDDGVDTGPIIIQAAVPVYPDDSKEELKDRILALEHKIYPRAIQLFAQGRLDIVERKVFIRDQVKEKTAYMVNPPLED